MQLKRKREPPLLLVRLRQAVCRHNLKAALSAAEAAGWVMVPKGAEWPKREDGVDEILSNYRKFISDRSELTSLLYDIDMLPEQCVTRAGAIRLAGLCAVWMHGESGTLPVPKAGAAMLAAAGEPE